MKKIVMITVLLVFTLTAFAVESGLSKIVGVSKQECITTAKTNLNFISVPLRQGWDVLKASDLAATIPNCNAVSKWNANGQGWEQASDLGFPIGWAGDFTVHEGAALMINVTDNTEYYAIFSEHGQCTYDLVTTAKTNLNAISIKCADPMPGMASEVAALIPNCNALSYWNAEGQGWEQASDLGFPIGWAGDFAVNAIDPLMINVTGNGFYNIDDDPVSKPMNSKVHTSRK